MITIHKNIFYDICNKNIDIYFDLINTIRNEYIETIYNLQKSVNVEDIRFNTHKLVSILTNITSIPSDELLYICYLLLLNEKTEDINCYIPYTEQIIQYNKSKLGL